MKILIALFVPVIVVIVVALALPGDSTAGVLDATATYTMPPLFTATFTMPPMFTQTPTRTPTSTPMFVIPTLTPTKARTKQ